MELAYTRTAGSYNDGYADNLSLTLASGVDLDVGGNIQVDSTEVVDDNRLIQHRSYTVATVPTGAAGKSIYVSDETGGATLAFHDGTNWRRVQDRAVVS